MLSLLLAVTLLDSHSWKCEVRPEKEGLEKSGYTFTEDIPKGLPDFSSWELIKGSRSFQIADRHLELTYEFYVSPDQPGLYQVVRYRFLELKSSDDRYRPRLDIAEHLDLNVGFGKSRYFVRTGQRTWRKLWLANSWRWREIEQRTNEFNAESINLINVLLLHGTPAN